MIDEEQRDEDRRLTLEPLELDDSAITATLTDRLIGTVFDDKYRIEEKLGQGGMAVVYRATHLLMDRAVAIKFLHAENIRDVSYIERFKQEARAAGRIQHPHAVGVTDFGVTEDGIFYLVMEYLAGITLRTRLRQGRIPCAEVVKIFSQVCQAVTAAHKCNVIHRDLKPDNIFLQQREQDTQVKVLDFGIAKITNIETRSGLTATGTIMGTFHYMSPEQCEGSTVTHACDIYSLGVIAYEMLAGQLPFTGSSSMQIAFKHMSEPPPALCDLVPELPLAAEAVVLRALAKTPNYRYQSAVQFADELAAALSPVSEQTPRARMSEPTTGSAKVIEPTPESASACYQTDPTVKCADANCAQPQPESNGHCRSCGTMPAGLVLRNRYELVRLIGKGGFGITYLVKDRDCFEEARVLKELRNDKLNDESGGVDAQRLFKREAQVLLNLQHAGIPELHAYFTEGQFAYLVQEFIPGRTIAEEMKARKQPYSESEAHQVLSELAEILEYLHTRKPPVIHRDIKPQNLMRHEKGRIILIDFGAVCQAVANPDTIHTLIGSPGYAPPEQVLGDAMPQSDLYAAGATIFYMLSGKHPRQIISKEILQNELALLEISRPFQLLIQDLMAADFHKRPESAAALRTRLDMLAPESTRARALRPSEQNDETAAGQLLLADASADDSAQNGTTREFDEQQLKKPDAQSDRQETPAAPGIDLQRAAAFCHEVESLLNSIERISYYSLFAVDRDADSEQIRAAYDRLRAQYHPDNRRGLIESNQMLKADLEKLMKHLDLAYEILTNSGLRLKYDAGLRLTGKLQTGAHSIPAPIESTVKPLPAAAWFKKGLEYYQAGKAEQALLAFRAAATQESKNAEYRIQLARCLLICGHPAEAEREYLRAITLAPYEGQFYLELGLFYQHQQQHKKAMETLEQAERLLPDNPITPRGRK